MGKHFKFTVAQLCQAIENSQGIVSTIQRHLEAILGEHVSWHAVDDAIKASTEAQKKVQDEKESILDICENRIIKEILAGDTPTAKWYLKMKGKERGYEETPTLQISNEDPLNINLNGNGMTADQIMAEDNVEINRGDEDGAGSD